jgi:hypothetical protein
LPEIERRRQFQQTGTDLIMTLLIDAYFCR